MFAFWRWVGRLWGKPAADETGGLVCADVMAQPRIYGLAIAAPRIAARVTVEPRISAAAIVEEC